MSTIIYTITTKNGITFSRSFINENISMKYLIKLLHFFDINQCTLKIN